MLMFFHETIITRKALIARVNFLMIVDLQRGGATAILMSLFDGKKWTLRLAAL